MQLGTWFAIYFIVWWVMLFTMLPLAVRKDTAGEDEVPGADAGAPIRPRLGFVLMVNTAASAVVFAGVWWLIQNYWV